MRASIALAVAAAISAGIALLTVVAGFLIRFAEPRALGLAVVPALLVAFQAFHVVWKRRTTERFGNPALMESLTNSYSPRRRIAQVALVTLGAWMLVLAAARPQWGERSREVRRQGIDVVFAIDISRSMLADDVAPDRLRAATAEIDRLLHLLEGDRVGLVVFAGVSFVQTPLTSDYGAIRLYLDRLHPDDLPVQGTAIGRAINEARELLTGGVYKERFERADNQLVIVFTDGEDKETDPVNAAALAYADGIEVFTVGIGTPEGARIPIRNPDGTIKEYLTDRTGAVVTTKLVEDQLVRIADAGSGEYFRYMGEGSVASVLQERISAYTDEALASMLRQEYRDRFMFFLVPGFLLIVLGTFIGDRRKNASVFAAAAAVLLFLPACQDALLRPDPHVEQALVLEGSGATESLHALMARVPEKAQKTSEYAYAYGFGLERLTEYESAQARYLDALNASDTAGQVAALFALGNTLAARDLLEPAIERYRRALVLDPTHDGVRRNLEIALRRLYPACVDLDDTLEENDDAASAKIPDALNFVGKYMPPGIEKPQDGTSSEKPTYISCGADADWFAIPVIGGSRLNISTDFTRMREDTGTTFPPDAIAPTAVRISLIGLDGQSVLAVDQGLDDEATNGKIPARSVKRTIDEYLVDSALDQDARLYLKVEVDEPLEYKYSLSIELIPPCWATEDEFESNDMQSTATAADTGAKQARLCPGNEDWYRVAITPLDALFVDLSPVANDDGEPVPATVDVYFNDEPTPRETRQLTTPELAEFKYPDTTGMTSVTLRVRSDSLEPANYKLDVYRYAPCPANDRLEPNNDPNARTQVKIEETPLRYLRICPTDIDWFEVPLAEPTDKEKEEKPQRPFSALVEIDEVPRQSGTADPAQALDPAAPPTTRAAEVVIYDMEKGTPISRSVVVNSPDGPRGFLASVALDWEKKAVAVAVQGEPGFYHLSFPDTRAAQNNQGGSDGEPQDDQQQQDQQNEPQDQQNADQNEEQQGEQPQPDEEQAPEEQQTPEEPAAAAEDTPEDEEAEQRALMQLLDSLEADDMNLPLQQALQNLPPSRMRDEW